MVTIPINRKNLKIHCRFFFVMINEFCDLKSELLNEFQLVQSKFENIRNQNFFQHQKLIKEVFSLHQKYIRNFLNNCFLIIYLLFFH